VLLRATLGTPDVEPSRSGTCYSDNSLAIVVTRRFKIPAVGSLLMIGIGAYRTKAQSMLTDFDQNTLANMTAALESVCNKIPPDRDAHDLRKRIGDAMIACAGTGKRTFVDFQDAGLRALEETMRKPKSNWLRGLFR
jgi:hypothetical protein